MSAPVLFDVLIVGGGAAGITAAGGLARQLYTAVVFSNETFRNARATHMHNFPTWDHQPPNSFRTKAKEDILGRYKTVQFENTDITTVAKTEAGQFEVKDAKGRSWLGRKLILANGSEDCYPDIAGYGDCFGYGIFHCLFCHGFEDRGAASSGVLAVGPHTGSANMALHQSRMARRLTEKVTFYTNGNPELAAELKQLLLKDKDAVAGRIAVDDRKIARLARGTAGESSVDVTFDDSSKAAEGFLVHQPTSRVSGPFAQQLGLELAPTGDIKVSAPFNEASVPGVFAVGDCATPMKAVPQAVAMGALAAGGISFQLGAELARID